MSIITVQDLQRNPCDFLRRVESGESFLVMQGNHPLAEVRPIPSGTDQLRPFGLCAGQFDVPGDFDEPLPPEVINRFEGQ